MRKAEGPVRSAKIRFVAVIFRVRTLPVAWALCVCVVLSVGGGSAAHAAGPDAQKPASSQRRTTFIGVVGGMALMIGVVGAYLALRSRRRPAPPRALAARPPEPVAQTVVSPSRMVCPTCREEYDEGVRFCENDGNRLVALLDNGAARGPTGAICPVCSHGYDPGVSLCPTDGEELIPWVLARKADAEPAEDEDVVATEAQTSKICPTCGSRYAGGAGFCCADGTALVVVN